ILGVGAYVVLHLTGNIKHTALLQNGVSQSPEPVDKYGHSPLNILVIGSDTRSTAANCKLGGDCGAGANADVEMLVHLSADRSNATVMSIPRDTVVKLPHCTDPTTHATGGGYSATINTSLQWGPSCTVQAVKNLTGLIIDHFVMVDFSGVETLSNALGGVQVCVSNKMYDSYSHLRLNQGVNMVKGLSALEFVRTRHGFYDGSDIGREKAQHYFLGAMIREVRGSMNLSDFGTLFKVADAATRALTVDDGLSGVTGLEGLATTMNRVPTDRISFVTMPWGQDPASKAHVIAAQPSANEMFTNLQNDVPYTATTGKATTTAPSTTKAPASTPATTQAPNALATPTVTVNKAQVHVQVLNGTTVNGRAAAVKGGLVTDGFTLASIGGTAPSSSTTKVYYPSSRADSAATVANALALPASALVQSSAYAEVTVVIGSDWPSGTAFGGASAGGAKAGAKAASAPSVASLSNAATTTGCVPVFPGDIVK
ncbi:MAG: LCP family protein, partial [Actinocrinis sp.]